MFRPTFRNTSAMFAAVVALSAVAEFSCAAENSTGDSSLPAQAAKTRQAGLNRTDVLRRDLDTSGREVIQVRVDFDPGVAAPKHSHPGGVEIVYVTEGILEYTLGNQPVITLHAGNSLYIPEGVSHVAKNTGVTVAKELATYIVNKNVPLVVLEK